MSKGRAWEVSCLIFSPGQPAAETIGEERVVERLAPKRGIFDAGLGQRAVEVEQPDQPRPSAAPVGDGEDRPLVRVKAGQDVVAVLPDGLGDDERRVDGDGFEDLQAVFLAVDETMAFLRVERMGAANLTALALDGGDEQGFHGGLGFLASLVGGKSQIAAGDQVNRFHEVGVRQLTPGVCRRASRGMAGSRDNLPRF